MTTEAWGWKLATDPDDVMNFINGCNGYDHPVKAAHVTAVRNGEQIAFHVFYQPGAPGQPPGHWGWKKSADPADAIAFLNGADPYCLAPEQAIVAAASQNGVPEFYIFYTYPLVPARITDCKVMAVFTGAFPRVRLGWTTCEGEPPQKMKITVFRSVGSRWENVMPHGEPCVVNRPKTTTAVDVLLAKQSKGPHKFVFCASYANHDEIEYTFDRMI